jgi:hypothetical protein
MAARIEQLAVGHAYVQTPEMRMGTIVQMAAPSLVNDSAESA